MEGKVVLVTGANSGIGKWTARGLAQRGATVILGARDAERGERAAAEVRAAAGHDRVHLVVADLASQEQVRSLADQVVEGFERLDVLINNAGVVLAKRSLTEDGVETALAINHLAPFLLTRLLLERLQESVPARIVNVSSKMHARGEIDFDDLQSERSYTAMGVYGRTKLMNLLFTRELARRLEGTGVTVNALHPGVVRTRIGADGDLGWIAGRVWALFLRFAAVSPQKGAETPVFLASSPEVEGLSGEYFEDCRPAKSASRSRDAQAAARLWTVSSELVGLEP